MAKIKNKKTNVIKDIKKDFEASMYISTGEWEYLEEEKEKKTPIINTKISEEK